MGKEKVYTIATTSGAVISVIGNLLLIPRFGVFGSGIACIIAESAVFAVSYWNLRDMFNLPQLFKDNLSIIIGSVIMYFIVRLISMLGVNVILKLLLELCGGMAVYFIIALITKNETFFMIFNKVFAFLNNFSNKRRTN
jgi:O-antigen/teichoic acid export membrane protein